MTIKEAATKSLRSFKTSLPIIVGILLLINLLGPFFQNSYSQMFSGDSLADPLAGAFLGSISFGIPITSYIVGGELLKEGVSLVAVTAFIMAWTTVGIVMLPLESSTLGMKFAIVRNIVNFVFSIIIAVLTVNIIGLFQ